MQSRSAGSAASVSSDGCGSSGSAWRGVLSGLAPLALLAAIAAVTLALTVVVRQLTMGQGFFVAQQAAVAVLSVGLALAGVAYLVGCIRALQRVRAWRLAGSRGQAAGMLWALGVTALVVALPVILGVVLPQHPAP